MRRLGSGSGLASTSFPRCPHGALKRSLYRGALLGVLLLPGCRMFDPQPLEFATDPHILRGRYEGVIDTRVTSHTSALTADGATLAMAEGDGRAVVQLWDTTTQTPLKGLGRSDQARSSYVDDVAVSADGSLVASAVGGKAHYGTLPPGRLPGRLPLVKSST